MRLDKYFSEMGILSRSQCKKALAEGRIAVDGVVQKKGDFSLDENAATVTLNGEKILYEKFVYYLVNKPKGYVSATEDIRDGNPCVTDLLPKDEHRFLFPCGRLDKNTTGIVLLTDNGDLAHRLLSPKHHVEKKYTFTVKFPLSPADVEKLEGGIDIGECVTKPCKVTLTDEKHGEIAITEGKYHQIKLMMEGVHNQITQLHRYAFGPLTLGDLSEGECRKLTKEEAKLSGFD